MGPLVPLDTLLRYVWTWITNKDEAVYWPGLLPWL